MEPQSATAVPAGVSANEHSQGLTASSTILASLASFASLPIRFLLPASEPSIISNQTNKPLFHALNQCFINAAKNQQGAYKDLNLKIVVGSTAFNGWFEFGNDKWTTSNDWVKKGRKGFCYWDAHCWLEDDEGNVYDYVFPWYVEVTQIRDAPGPLKVGLIEKVSKKNCQKKRGLTYVPAPPNVQAYILHEFRSAGRI